MRHLTTAEQSRLRNFARRRQQRAAVSQPECLTMAGASAVQVGLQLARHIAGPPALQQHRCRLHLHGKGCRTQWAPMKCQTWGAFQGQHVRQATRTQPRCASASHCRWEQEKHSARPSPSVDDGASPPAPGPPATAGAPGSSAEAAALLPATPSAAPPACCCCCCCCCCWRCWSSAVWEPPELRRLSASWVWQLCRARLSLRTSAWQSASCFPICDSCAWVCLADSRVCLADSSWVCLADSSSFLADSSSFLADSSSFLSDASSSCCPATVACSSALLVSQACSCSSNTSSCSCAILHNRAAEQLVSRPEAWHRARFLKPLRAGSC